MNMNKETDIIVKEIGSHNFPGFYESLFCASDDFIDLETELEEELKQFGENISVYYEYENYKEYEKDVCIAFMEKYIEKVKETLPYKITDDDEFIFNLIDKEDIIIVSPKYYNFSTDKCYSDIKTNIKTLNAIKNYTLEMDGAKEYIIKHFTSYDGFISFINNDIEYWKELPIEDYEENMLIALLDMLLLLDNDDNIFDIELSVLDRVCKECYVYPIVYYNKKEYSYKTDINELNDEKTIKIVEFIKNHY